MPSFIKVDLDNFAYFSTSIQISFIFVNFRLVHDLKWLAFIMVACALEEQSSRNDILIIKIENVSLKFNSWGLR